MKSYRKAVITGGAGFVGSSLALLLKRQFPTLHLIALDNLYRRGSELALPRLKEAGIEFIHGDVRCKEDLTGLQEFDLLIECSAEPSVRAGYGQDPSYLLNTNLLGTLHCLEAARKTKSDLIFLSTSRVYSIEKLRELPLSIKNQRFTLSNEGIGWSSEGITTAFSLEGTRSLYGATKLASELILKEYAQMYDLNIVINRCGVIAGPWQMGKVDQGFISLWLARHLFRKELKYTGFGGQGYQVRDVLHVEDLFHLILLQLEHISKHKGKVYNVGGGLDNSISLAELTHWCTNHIGPIPIQSNPSSHPADIPFYITDNKEITEQTGWRPKKKLPLLLQETAQWLQQQGPTLEKILL